MDIQAAKPIKVSIQGIEIDGIKNDGIPIPDVNLERATLRYISLKNNTGQILVDTSAHEKDTISTFRVWILDTCYYEYEGKIIDYHIQTESYLIITAIIQLCGKFKYVRYTDSGEEVVEREFKEAEIL